MSEHRQNCLRCGQYKTDKESVYNSDKSKYCYVLSMADIYCEECSGKKDAEYIASIVSAECNTNYAKLKENPDKFKSFRYRCKEYWIGKYLNVLDIDIQAKYPLYANSLRHYASRLCESIIPVNKDNQTTARQEY